MIKWLLTGLEDAYSVDSEACRMWDSLETEWEDKTPPQWEDTTPPPRGYAAPVLALAFTDHLLARNCMWGGRCGSHDHGAPPSRCEPPPPTKPRVVLGAGESLLKSSVLLRAQQPSPPPSPPPERGEASDSEKAMVFVSMTDVLSEVRWTTCAAAAEEPPPRPAPVTAPASQVHEDHSYHLTKHSHRAPSIRLDNLGVQTPSDSGTDEDFFEDEIMELPEIDADDVDFFGPESVFKDIAESVAAELRPVKQQLVSESESGHRMSESEEEEEIDVVSVAVDKARTLPTNPSMRDCRELQQTVADAVGKRGRRHHHHHHHHRRHHHHHRRRRGRPGRKPKRRRPVEAASDADDSEGDCNKRSLHNDMERQRRIDLSNLVRSVRQVVPSISEKDRAPRIVVLREAAHYCRQLQVESKQLADYKQELLRINNKLHRMHRLALHNLPTQSLHSLHGHRSNKLRRSKDTA